MRALLRKVPGYARASMLVALGGVLNGYVLRLQWSYQTFAACSTIEHLLRSKLNAPKAVSITQTARD